MGLYSEGLINPLLSQGFLHLRFGGLIFGRVFFWEGGGLVFEFYGICSKGFTGGLIFGKRYFRRGLLLEGILPFKMGRT